MIQSAKLPVGHHTGMPWRIHAIANDFRVQDVWSLPTPGAPDDFPRLVALMGSFNPAQSSRTVGALFAIRWRLGRWLGLDRDDAGLGGRVHSLRERLPADLAGAAPLVGGTGQFTLLYETHDEAAFEIANRTVHGVLHLGWVPDGDGGHRGQMAVLVRPNGALGDGYMVAIAPFRHALVYPMMLREVGRLWRQRDLVRQIDVPDDARDVSTLPAVDYADAFLVDTVAHPQRSVRDWATAVLEAAPSPQRAQLLAGWSALGLKAADTGESVLGWEVRRDGDDVVLLGRDSRVGMPGELLFARRSEGLLFATFVHHRSPATRAVWAGVRRTHVRTVLELLERAARYPAGGGGSGPSGAGGGGGASPGVVGRLGPGDICG
jgi:uncharacterized protein DUF2867